MSQLRAAQMLRARAFRPDIAQPDRDADPIDEICTHFLIAESHTQRLVCSFRVLPLSGGGEIARSYSARFYDLTALTDFPGKMVEIGRFCIDSDFANDPDILRLAWGAMARFVDEQGIKLLFGCSSFAGTETQAYLESFAMLKERHLAPARWQPRIKAADVVRFAPLVRGQPDVRQALRSMPPLLRTYLMMGGWVSDHAVVDKDLNTLHVFTGVEIAAIPSTRKRLLRAVASAAFEPIR